MVRVVGLGPAALSVMMMRVSAPVQLVLVRAALGDLALRPGTMLAARVLARDGAQGTLLLAGVRVTAQLPEGIEAGEHLRLRVQEASDRRVELRVVEPPAPPQAAAVPATAYALALPGGAIARLVVGEDAEGAGGRGAGRAAVSLRYDSPQLGRMDFALSLDAAGVATVLDVAAGEPHQRARAAVGELREALAQATGRPARVAVRPRGATLDVRA
jgi:hypothetical protein